MFVSTSLIMYNSWAPSPCLLCLFLRTGGGTLSVRSPTSFFLCFIYDIYNWQIFPSPPFNSSSMFYFVFKSHPDRLFHRQVILNFLHPSFGLFINHVSGTWSSDPRRQSGGRWLPSPSIFLCFGIFLTSGHPVVSRNRKLCIF